MQIGPASSRDESRVHGKPPHNQRQRVPVIIFGTHAESWNLALGPDAPVWKLIPEVSRVSMVRVPQDPSPAAEAFEGERPVLIPLMEPHIVARPGGFREFAPSAPMVRVLGNKKRFSDYLREQRLSSLAPRTWDDPKDIDYPSLVKRADLNGSRGIVLAKDESELKAILLASEWQDVEFVFQEFLAIPNDYSTYCVCRSGSVIWHGSFHFERNDPWSIRLPGRNQSRRFFVQSDSIVSSIERVLAPLKYTGPCCVDYKIRPDGEICILEINPRLGGSVMWPENVDHLRGILSCVISNAISHPTCPKGSS